MDVQDLVALEEIRRLKYRYCRTLDLKLWDDFADTLTPDASAAYGAQLVFGTRAEIVEFMRGSLSNQIITMHHCHHPEIEVDGRTAEGIWYLEDTVIIPDLKMVLTGASFYTDRYLRCEDGKWRITRTSYERTYEATMSLEDLPSFQLTAP